MAVVGAPPITRSASGTAVGLAVGVGAIVGVAVGEGAALAVGAAEAVAADVGVAEGATDALGAADGAAVGFAVAAMVGVGIGGVEPPPPPQSVRAALKQHTPRRASEIFFMAKVYHRLTRLSTIVYNSRVKDETVVVSGRVSPDVRAELRAVAAKRGESASELVARAVVHLLNRLKGRKDHGQA